MESVGVCYRCGNLILDTDEYGEKILTGFEWRRESQLFHRKCWVDEIKEN